MSYGPGYTMWQEILRERQERRHARYVAKRDAEFAASNPAEQSPPARKRGRPRLTAPTAETTARPSGVRRSDPK